MRTNRAKTQSTLIRLCKDILNSDTPKFNQRNNDYLCKTTEKWSIKAYLNQCFYYRNYQNKRKWNCKKKELI